MPSLALDALRAGTPTVSNRPTTSTARVTTHPGPQRRLLAAQRRLQTAQRRLVAPQASGNDGESSGNLGDDLLDFMYAGKKLRKWYGQEGQVLPRDGGSGPSREPEPEPAADVPRDSVLILDADTAPMAEQVLLQLILARAKVKALVRDREAAQAGFGPYVDVTAGNGGDTATVRSAGRAATAMVLCGDVTPSTLSAAAAAGVPHIVLLSAVGAPRRGGFAALFGPGREIATLENVQREAAVESSGIPYTIVRVGGLEDSEGGVTSLAVTAGDVGGSVSREDAALVLARAAERDVGAQGSLRVAVVAGGAGAPPNNWAAVFGGLAGAKAAS